MGKGIVLSPSRSLFFIILFSNPCSPFSQCPTPRSPAVIPTQCPPCPHMAMGLSQPPIAMGHGLAHGVTPLGGAPWATQVSPATPSSVPPHSVPCRERCPCPHSRGDAGCRGGTGSKGTGKATRQCPHGLETTPPPSLSPQSHPQTSAMAAVPWPQGSQPHPNLGVRATGSLHIPSAGGRGGGEHDPGTPHHGVLSEHPTAPHLHPKAQTDLKDT